MLRVADIVEVMESAVLSKVHSCPQAYRGFHCLHANAIILTSTVDVMVNAIVGGAAVVFADVDDTQR